jgi:hypothetical protein
LLDATHPRILIYPDDVRLNNWYRASYRNHSYHYCV